MQRPAIPDRELLTIREVARRLSLSVRSVYRCVKAGQLPPPVYLRPRMPRWRPGDLETFVAQLPVP